MILDYYLLLSVVVNCVYDNVEHDVVSLGWSFLSSLMNDIGVLLYFKYIARTQVLTTRVGHEYMSVSTIYEITSF